MVDFVWWFGAAGLALVAWYVIMLSIDICKVMFWTLHYHVYVLRREHKQGRLNEIKWQRLPSSLWGTFCSIAGGWTVCSGKYKWSIDGVESDSRFSSEREE